MTPSEFKAWFPRNEAFQMMNASEIQTYLTRAVPYFDVTRWGGFYSEGVACFVAHSIVMDASDGANELTEAAGIETSASVGDTSFSISSELVNAQAKDHFMRTRYGQRYKKLQRMIGAGGTCV